MQIRVSEIPAVVILAAETRVAVKPYVVAVYTAAKNVMKYAGRSAKRYARSRTTMATVIGGKRSASTNVKSSVIRVTKPDQG